MPFNDTYPVIITNFKFLFFIHKNILCEFFSTKKKKVEENSLFFSENSVVVICAFALLN